MARDPETDSRSGAGPVGPSGPGRSRTVVAIAVIAVSVAAVLAVALLPFVDLVPFDSRTLVPAAPPGPEYVEPPDPPEALSAEVEAGRRALRDPSLGGNGLSCSSCHFEAGRTGGGRNGGISLVGAAAGYPRAADGRVITLPDRITRCLVHALGGSPPGPESAEMTAMVTYLRWLSDGVEGYSRPHWLGVEPLPVEAADPARGVEVFATVCAPCHGSAGGGTDIAPAVWGGRSFGAGSELAETGRLAGFVEANMPRQNPFLDRGQAADVAAFVLEQRRPG